MADPDWFARVVSLGALAISAVTFIWTRFDKHRERKSAEQADLPAMSLYWNPQIDKEGWYRLMLTIRDVDKAFRLDRARLINPRGSLIAIWKDGRPGAARAAEIDLKWPFQPKSETALLHSTGDYREALLLQTDEQRKEVKIVFEGRFLSGTMKPFEIPVVAYRD
ncbi:hypothetical protein [Bradyrhizobium elkanii]|uniref:Uncharacterized protein n=1 Tax=Bradyrhizobium elkanii TaxID=29448 RepID=A0A8I1YCS7_BRAEL|nr:hypothetical protein [Bradyrhizobium elkanii]MBP1297565.1 hypothetical protein [Bradyrhizobium elkanii]MCS3577671.1 hypothetical protein [Bradyrhizobium elkanii]MCS3720546.1 hypothetical protein [Bradyrhizobium elkanii]MCS4004963.1 hypothetical protein [Bradyrhizobium elkanii USDA 61]BBC00119.1 hypothetical protein BE61_55730 [Bradyrhizobium elkanii USDA 61]